MRNYDGRVIFSASDLVNFMGCDHASVLDIRNLVTPATFAPDDENAVLLQEKGIQHERAYLRRLQDEGRSVYEVASAGTLEERAEATRRAMLDGYDVVYQGAFLIGRWHGYSDFLLRRDDATSSLGAYAYDVADTKLARSAKAKHVLQLCVYAEMLADVQGVMPPQMHVVLGSGEVTSLRTSSVLHYFGFARRRFEAFVHAPPPTSAGDPCGHCTFCRWSDRCKDEWEAADHLSIVAGMGRGQIAALRGVGVDDIEALGALPAGTRVDGMQPDTVARLTAQARLQAHQRRTGERQVEVLPAQPGRGFARLPQPDRGDMFFDMEGDPLFDGGLEYLFGLVAFDDHGDDRFHEFWAHDRETEKVAFERTVDFMVDRLARFPAAHIYHYAAYEQTALKKLAMYHGTREAEVDDLLRGEKFVDLYRVVAESNQLRTIFAAPLYVGCLDGERGYAVPGDARPQNARYWIPLIGLHTGMRLNEICQLDVTDVRCVESIWCFTVSEASESGAEDKGLKTRASERVVPLHQNLIDLGILKFVADRKHLGHSKLFYEIAPGPKGIRAVAFSKWFTQFLRKCGAARPRTCYHSFRHNFRDALRSAKVPHDIALALGGWSGGSGSRNSSENYGNGFAAPLLQAAIDSLTFNEIDIDSLRTPLDG